MAPARAKIKGAAGRAAVAAEVTTVKSVEDWPALFGFFREREDVRVLLINHANAVLKTGIAVPGITTQTIMRVK